MTLDPRIHEYLDRFGRTRTLREIAGRRGRWRRHWIALRHDVDHDLDLALELAHAQHKRGIRATYFVLHTAPYWDEPDLTLKCLQLQDYGHEIGLHLDLVSEWARGVFTDPDARIRTLLWKLRGAGVRVSGTAAHGSKDCYEQGCANDWFWRELRPADPVTALDGRSAEGPRLDSPRYHIRYPNDHALCVGGRSLPLWSVSMRDHRVRYEAATVSCDRYWSDSGGRWDRSPDPLGHDLSTGRHIVLMHPWWWRGPERVIVALCENPRFRRSFASALDACTPLRVFDEWTLTHTRNADRIEPTPRIEDASAARLHSGLAHHANLVRGDVFETTTLLSPRASGIAEIPPGPRVLGIIGVHEDRGTLARDLGALHPTLYDRPESAALWDDPPARWAWMTRHARLRAHLRAGARGMRALDPSSRIRSRTPMDAALVTARLTGVPIHDRLMRDWIARRGHAVLTRLPRPSDRAEAPLWAEATPLCSLSGSSLARHTHTRHATLERGKPTTIRWLPGNSSAPRVVIDHPDLQLDPGEYLLGLIRLSSSVSGVRLFVHAVDKRNGARSRHELDPLPETDRPTRHRFAICTGLSGGRVRVSMLAPNSGSEGFTRLDRVELRAAPLDRYFGRPHGRVSE